MEDHAAKLRRGISARVAELKAALAQWIDAHTGPADQATATIAMLETVLDRFIDTHGEEVGVEMILTALRKKTAKSTTLQ